MSGFPLFCDHGRRGSTEVTITPAGHQPQTLEQCPSELIGNCHWIDKKRVGWVERSETHQCSAAKRWVSQGLNPSYEFCIDKKYSWRSVYQGRSGK
jgi:hypothetical protein